MKKVLLMLIPVLIFISCKKETPATPDLTSNAALKLSDDADFPLDYVIYNPCTSEYMHVTGNIKYHFKATIVGEVIHYNYAAIYDSLKGEGLTTGNKYQGSGHVFDNYKGIAYLDQGVYIAYSLIEHIANKVMFVTPGGKNNFTQDLTYNLHTTKEGVQIENISWKFAYCQ